MPPSLVPCRLHHAPFRQQRCLATLKEPADADHQLSFLSNFMPSRTPFAPGEGPKRRAHYRTVLNSPETMTQSHASTPSSTGQHIFAKRLSNIRFASARVSEANIIKHKSDGQNTKQERVVRIRRKWLGPIRARKYEMAANSPRLPLSPKPANPGKARDAFSTTQLGMLSQAQKKTPATDELLQERRQLESTATKGVGDGDVNSRTWPLTVPPLKRELSPGEGKIRGGVVRRCSYISRELVRRSYHTSPKRDQQETIPYSEPSYGMSEIIPAQGKMPEIEKPAHIPIRERLRLWQEQQGLTTNVNPGIPQEIPGTGMAGFTPKQQQDDLEQFDEDSQPTDDDAVLDDEIIRPGAIIEVRHRKGTFNDPELAVVIRQSGHQLQYYSIKGKWARCSRHHVQWSLPDFIPLEEVAKLLPYVPTRIEDTEWDRGQLLDKSIPRSMGAPIVSKMKGFLDECESVYRKRATILDECYELIAHDVHLRYGTLERITKNLLLSVANQQGHKEDLSRNVTDAEIWAVRRAIITKGGIGFDFQAWGPARTMVFQIRPRQQVREIEEVAQWIRDYQEAQVPREIRSETRENSQESSHPGVRVIQDFIAKALGLIDKSRLHRRESYFNRVGPSKKQFPLTSEEGAVRVSLGPHFLPDEQKIIRFLELESLTKELRKDGRFDSLSSTILKATERYGDGYRNERGTPTCLLLLQEIGAVPPYVNQNLYSEHLMLPAMNISKHLSQLSGLVEDQGRTGRHGFKDSLRHIRKDWDTTPVYCIDDHGAQEIDDGLSVERIPDNPSEAWVHVHVANPCAFFDHNHLVSKLASHMTETIYSPEANFPMLPPWVSQGHFSLAPNRPVLTFSSRINGHGQILDTKIEAGIIRNVISLTPDQVSKAFGQDSGDTNTQWTIEFGGPWQDSESTVDPPQISETTRQDLQLLIQLSRGRTQARKEKGAVVFARKSPDVQVRSQMDQKGLPLHLSLRDRARFMIGDPALRLKIPRFSIDADADNDSHEMVREMMILACESAAVWARQRKVPFLYRGTRRYNLMDEKQFEQDFYNKTLDENGTPSLFMADRKVSFLGRSSISTDPEARHEMLATEAYCKVTSPLRRYADMMAHWQVQAALLEEARIGRSLTSRDSKKTKYPFPTADLDAAILRLAPRERLIKATKSRSISTWFLIALSRAVYHKEIPFPEEFTFYVDGDPKNAIKDPSRNSQYVFGYIEELSFRALLLDTPPGHPDGPLRPGDQWTCRIEEIPAGVNNVICHPIRLKHRNEEHCKIHEAFFAWNAA